MAFTANNVTTQPKTPNRGQGTITSTMASSTLVTVMAGPPNGTKVFMICATATTTQAADVNWGILNTTSSFSQIATVAVPANAGNLSSISAVTLFVNANNPSFNSQQFFYLTSTADSFAVKSPVTLVSGQIYVTAQSADF